MSRVHEHRAAYEPAPHARSPKKNPFAKPTFISHTARMSPGRERKELFPSEAEIFTQGQLGGTTHDSDQSLLEMLNSTVACLKQKHMDLEALGCLEQSLWLKRRMFGVDNSVVHKALNEVMLSYNSVAMQYLAQGQFDQCLAMLRKAEAITAPGNFKRCQALQILTFNNIGCCYRKLGKLKSALKYLKEAAQIGSGSTHVKNLSITHLNLCAIQSQLGRHDLALEHAQAAIFHTQEELVSLRDTDDRDEDDDRGNDKEQAALIDALDAKTREEKIIALAVAYHNLAVELEFNGRGEASLQWYKKALQLVWKYRESNVALCESFKKIFLDAKKKQKTANVRQNGILNGAAGGRKPITRPRSAHASSRNMNAADVSYSSTVASHCYKATKPSTAGQHYGSPRKNGLSRSGKQQRPSSAAPRQRPMSAKMSIRSKNQEAVRRPSEDALELHWKKLEREYALNDSQATESQRTSGEQRKRRPQSAGGSTSGAQFYKRAPMESHRREKLQGQICFAGHDTDIIGNDEDYGVILDDGDSEDGFDDYGRLSGSGISSNQSEVEATDNSKYRRPGIQRHRRVLNDARSQISRDGLDGECSSAPGPEEESPSTSLTGYNGDDDADTDSELPAQRVCHMEYLRRMKRLAESIKDDLNGVGTRPPTAKPAQLAGNNSKRRVEAATPTSAESSPRLTTPRSATSKVRDRLEQARRESLGSLHEAEASHNTPHQIVPITSDAHEPTNSTDAGVDIYEDYFVFKSEAEAQDAEIELFRAAAGRRLQAFFRGHLCRSEVKQLKQVKLQNDAANMIQRQVRQYLLALAEQRCREEEKAQLELQREEVEDMAACLIQRLYHRTILKTAEKDHDEEEESPPQRRNFSIADVVLGAAVSMSTGTNQALREEPPHIHAAATVPRLDLSQSTQREEPRRSSTVPSISLDGSMSEAPIHEEVNLAWESSRRSDEQVTGNVGETTPHTNRSESNNAADQRDAAAIRIQAPAKGFAVRRHIARQEAGDLSRMYIERKHFDVAFEHALELEQSFLEELSAIKIQALVRGQQSRLLTECIKAGVITAATTIQRSFRIHRVKTQRAVDEGVRSIAARTIQQVFRDYEERRAAIHQAAVDLEVLAVQDIAATTIQNFWRQNFTARDHRLEEIEAATCIQALGRGHLTRKSLKSLHGSSTGSGLSKPSSAFSMSSSAEKIVEEDNFGSARNDSMGINCSFLPTSIRELYLSSSQIRVSRANDRINAREIAELGLTFADFLQEFEACTDEVVAPSALDAMRVLVESSPETSKTLANVVRLSQALDRRLHDGFWSQAIEVSSLALLQAFKDVLDAQ